MVAATKSREQSKSEKFLKAAGVTPRPSQLDLLGQVLGVPLPELRGNSLAPPELGDAKGIRYIALKNLIPDPNNPRGGLGDLKDLTASIETFGVLQPLLVRPLGAPHARGERFMIIVGHRRHGAGGKAGLKDLPCIVRPMSDAEALEVQLIENGQRKDLQALEEADTFARLVKEYSYAPDAIARRVGKSKAHVLARLKLRTLCPLGRKLLEAGKLNASLAVPVARIKDPKAQERYLERACPKDGPALHLRAALELLHAEHVRSLKSPPFDMKDPELAPEAGPCTTCPRRSGAVDGLSDDLEGHDHCLGPECFDRKAKAAWRSATEKFRADKLEVLPIAKGQALFKAGNALQWDGPFVEVDAPAPEDPKKRTWGQLIRSLPKDKVAIGAERVPVVIAADLKMKPRKLYPRELALRALSDYGVKWAVTKVEEATIEGNAQEARELYAEQRQEREIRNRAAVVMVAKVFEKTPEVKRPEAMLMLELIEEQLPEDERTPESELDGMNLGQLLRRGFRGLLRGLENAWQGYDPRLLELAKRHGVDVKMIENAIKRELADAEASERLAKTGEGQPTNHESAAARAAAVVSEARPRSIEEAITAAGEPVREVDPEAQDPDVEADQLSQDATAPLPDPESLTTPAESDDTF